ncbi:MAG: glycosyltransferase family 9 protein [Chthoniobacteraceae bacterium]
MRILALQLKRIGDLVLTTPALAALKSLPDANITLGVHAGTAGLLPAIEHCDSAIVFGGGWTPWQQTLTGRFDVVLDFTGTDRSALAAFAARARRRITFEWVRRKRLRALAHNEFVESSVRERHTADHYLDLLQPLGIEGASAEPVLRSPGKAAPQDYAVLHPGTARAEKNWLAERWGDVARHLSERHGLKVVVTSGPDPSERAHALQIQPAIHTPADLCAFAALLARARIVVSCDTAAVHLAAAFQRPQVALFGPTNPFHWRPRHERAAVISAAKPDAPLTSFDPRMKGAPMDGISTAVVCRAIDALLAT